MEGFDKKHPGFDKVVGPVEHEAELLRLHIAEKILKEKPEIKESEREKTTEEEMMIFGILKKIPEFVKEYGGEKARFTSIDQIHILTSSEINAGNILLKHSETVGGCYQTLNGRIDVVSSPEKEDILETAHVLTHELMHTNSFASLTVAHKKNAATETEIRTRRSGISIKGREQSPEENNFFLSLNEAVTEELARRFMNKYFSNIKPLSEKFKKYTEDGDKMKKNINTKERPIAEVVSEFLLNPNGPAAAYVGERVEFWAMIEEVFIKNKDKFETREDVFKVFSMAYFTGRLLPLSRLLEKTFGKGSFGRFAENSRKRSNFVDELTKELISESENTK